MRSVTLALFVAVSLSAAVGLAQAAHHEAPARAGRHPHELPAIPAADGAAYYIVQLQDEPAATYAGGVPGYAATSPRYRGGRMLDVAASASYVAYLQDRQEALLGSARALLGHEMAVRFRYRYALDGLSVKLTPAEAARLAALPGVVSVQPVRYFAPAAGVGMPAAAGNTNASRAWINAPVVWQLPTTGADNEGEGIVFADLDTGINHANSSFAATGPRDGYVAQDPGNLRFGVCDGGNGSQAPKRPGFFNCNDKLIGAYTYTQNPTDDPKSPEDSEGHGTHTASTVVGDFVNVTLHGSVTHVSGVAPHASVIAYDVCDPTNLCGEDNSVAAVEQAIQDQDALRTAWGSSFKGMVLNFSIGGGADAYNDPVEQAFLKAVEAGIYVSASGGNGGPSNAVDQDPTNFPQYPVEHVGPWVATNAAATHDGGFSSDDLENFSGGDAGTRPSASLKGAGFTAGFGPHTVVHANDFAAPPVRSGTAPTSGEDYPASQGAFENGRQCLYPYPAGTFTSTEIVVCDRGTIALVDKAYNVKQGGAHGMVIATTSGSSQDLPVESYVIPATLLGLSEGSDLRAWLTASSGSGTPPQADISGSVLTTNVSQADEIAGFSSRGPTSSRYDSLVKPDLSGPGVSVLAAVADPAYADGCSGCANQPETYDFFDGTSMASPHDAGSAALLMQAHPAWTPAEIKSALMLTAVTTGLTDQCDHLDGLDNCVAGSTLPSPQVRGAGRVDVDAADRTGLIMDETGAHYRAAKNGGLNTLNLASAASNACDGICTWTRTVTSAFGSATVHYSAGTSDLSTGLAVTVSPASFTLAPGQSRKLTITADATGVAIGAWAFGQVDITTGDAGDGGAAVPAMHMPLVVRATRPAPHMSIDQSELDFSAAPQASDATKFTITNSGQEPLHWALKAGKSCSGGGIQGFSVSASAGTIPLRSSSTVTATFKAGSLAPGSYTGVVCVTSDASDFPKLTLGVKAKVTGDAGSSGGGGGEEGMFVLTALALLLRRRLKKD